jgi:hypothetical protein
MIYAGTLVTHGRGRAVVTEFDEFALFVVAAAGDGVVAATASARSSAP